MQHLKELLTAKRLNIKNILEQNLIITEKIDGNAFQSYNDNGNIIYGKRGENPYKPVINKITDFDLILNPLYYKIYNYLNEYLNILKNYSILNFEIFDETQNNHIIKYHGQYKNDIVLLSGVAIDGHILTPDELKDAAYKLNVSEVEILWSGKLNNNVIDSILNYKLNDVYLWKTVLSELNIDVDEKTEGLVLTFDDNKLFCKRTYKLQNPVFTTKLLEHLYDEQHQKENINFEEYYDLVKKCNYKVDNNLSHLENLLRLYLTFNNATNDYTEVENNLKKVEILRTTEINMLLTYKICNIFPKDLKEIKYPALLNFILYAFRNKRKRTSLWCSKEYQKDLNIFLETTFKI